MGKHVHLKETGRSMDNVIHNNEQNNQIMFCLLALIFTSLMYITLIYISCIIYHFNTHGVMHDVLSFKFALSERIIEAY
ncbi:hypothetical protein SAMN05192534_11085 [Alteribacillus persepolensis]|uniref:Uncharacterized protein n=1 Tax=Alteribacillus persepolensis TaxID=568899 RepID=A0A1G8EVL2_9BACI|nr:hypothetical protein [Alteribacillus persepolensis]SDH73875.1 hypothetical protein SAMN05192534_11085 [Alteribacillus persepolensis]